MCLIQLSVTTPHPVSTIFKCWQELPLVALQTHKIETNCIPGFSLQSGAYRK
jgi:hypothetical protein